MRGSQSDPSHTPAPVHPRYARAVRVWPGLGAWACAGALIPRSLPAVKGQVGAVWRGYNGLNSGATARFSVWPMRWPMRWVLGAFLA